MMMELMELAAHWQDSLQVSAARRGKSKPVSAPKAQRLEDKIHAVDH
jgi:hypothetical protein